MALIFNGVEVTDVYFNGTKVDVVNYDGTEVFSSTLTFANASWGRIAEIAASGEAQDYFAVGDEKDITLSTGEEITLVILGFNHDDLTAGGKAAITIGMENLLAARYAMNTSNINAGGWHESRMRTNTMVSLFSQLPVDLRAVIKPVNKKTSVGAEGTAIITSSDQLWLLGEVEINNTTTAVLVDEGMQYEYWRTIKNGTDITAGADRVKRLSNGGGSANTWWLRSPHMVNSTSFRNITTLGNYNNNNNASGLYGVSFGFCI